MLRNMVGIMTDRANTMKAFDRQLDSLRTEVANPEIQLEFLYCNAHFLFGLTTAAEKALTEVAKERGLEGKLGRETMLAFQCFKKPESAACRYL